MFQNFLKIALRQLWKNKTYSVISLLGLSVAIAAALLLCLYIRGEWSYDRYHYKPEKVYRVVFDDYLDLGPFATTPLPVGPALEQDFPEVDAMSRISTGFNSLVRYQHHSFFEDIAFIDTGFVDIFSLQFIQGDPEQALATPNQIIISESYAQKYFGDDNPVGQTLEVGSSGSFNSMVTGVYEDFPQESSIQFDMAMPFSTFEKVYGAGTLWQQMPANYTFLRLNEQAGAEQLIAQLPSFVEKYVGEEIETFEKYQLNLQPLLDIHLYSDYGREANTGNLATLYLLGIIGLMLLAIAGINYVNYSIAGFSKRIKEISVRKVMGASRQSLIRQFLGETLITVMLAGGLALVWAEMLLPVFNSTAGKAFQTTDLHHWTVYLVLGLCIPVLGLVAGIFPALFLSGFRLSNALRGKFSNLSVAEFSRKGLVVGQFAVSIALIVGTLVVWQQMDFVRENIRPDLSEQVAVFKINNQLADRFNTLEQELKQNPGIISVAGGSNMPTFYGDSWPVHHEALDKPVQTENYAIRGDYLEAMGYELLAGRTLDPDRPSDVNAGFVINRTAVKELGFSSPEEAVGQAISWGGGSQRKEGTILGVIEDFHFQSLKDKVEPALLQFAPYDWMDSQFVAVRFYPAQAKELMASIQNTVKKLDPSWHAEVKYLDENFMEIHQQDAQLGRVFQAFALLALIISCMGLFGLAAFAAVRRTKEIGIRKVLGATVMNVVKLLTQEFLWLVLIAMLIAIPLSWFVMNRWLNDFAYRITIEPWVFLLAGATAILVAALTVGSQSVKAALADPVNSLRDE